jgi:hypothetical protein
MTVVSDFIDAEVALLAREVVSPVAPFFYGVDLSCVEDVTDDLAEVDPNSVTALGEALLRRLTTPRGTLPDDRNYGIDVRSFCNLGMSTQDIRDLASKIRSEVTKDDRVDDAAVTIGNPVTSDLSIAVQVTPVDRALGVFTLTLAVTDGQLLLEAIN